MTLRSSISSFFLNLRHWTNLDLQFILFFIIWESGFHLVALHQGFGFQKSLTRSFFKNTIKTTIFFNFSESNSSKSANSFYSSFFSFYSSFFSFYPSSFSFSFSYYFSFSFSSARTLFDSYFSAYWCSESIDSDILEELKSSNSSKSLPASSNSFYFFKLRWEPSKPSWSEIIEESMFPSWKSKKLSSSIDLLAPSWWS